MNTHLFNSPSSSKEELRQQVLQGAIERYGNEFIQTPAFTHRAETELQTLCSNERTISYLLMVADYVNAARKMGIDVGPGRSSAAGSLVLYCLKITDIDPLRYGLLFERFYSDNSVVPLIDIDVESCERDKVTDYVAQKFGETRPGKTNILGLTVLTMIKRCMSNIKQAHGIDIDLKAIPQNDERTFRLFQEGRTIGVFQFEAEDMRKHLQNHAPQSFDELMALNALFRPLTMENLQHYIARKKGIEPTTFVHPVVEDILKETRGIIVYQEQIMLLFQRLANFTPEESDKLRRTFGKISPVVEELKRKFIRQGLQNGYDELVLSLVWDDIKKSALLAFVKAHSACYTWLAYQVAYLKAHYPMEFLDAYATIWERDVDGIKLLEEELRSITR